MEREPCGCGRAAPAQQKTRGLSERGAAKAELPSGQRDRKQDGRGRALQKNKGAPQA